VRHIGLFRFTWEGSACVLQNSITPVESELLVCSAVLLRAGPKEARFEQPSGKLRSRKSPGVSSQTRGLARELARAR
jgi:hypothetical protein